MIEKLKKSLAKVIKFLDYVQYRWWYYTTFFTNDKKNKHYWKTPLENLRFYVYFFILKLLVVLDDLVCCDNPRYPLHVLKRNFFMRCLLYIPNVVTRSLLKFFYRVLNILIAKQVIRLKGLPLILDREYKNYFVNSFACLTGEFCTWPATKQAMYLCWTDKLLDAQQDQDLEVAIYERPKREDWDKLQQEIAEFKKGLSSSSLKKKYRKK